MQIKFGLPSIGGVLINAPSLWLGFKWLLDWKGRLDTGAGVMSYLPDWFYAVALIVGLVLIWWDFRRPRNAVTVVVTPLAIAGLVTVLALAAWGWYLFDRAQGPIVWTYGDGPHPIFAMRGGGTERPLITAFQITGHNRSSGPVNVNGNLRSNITNESLPLFFRVDGAFVRTDQTNGVPAHADFMIIVPFTDNPTLYDTLLMSTADFLARFGDLTLTVTMDGRRSPYTRRFTPAELEKTIDDFEKSLRTNKIEPRITKK